MAVVERRLIGFWREMGDGEVLSCVSGMSRECEREEREVIEREPVIERERCGCSLSVGEEPVRIGNGE